MAADNEHWGYRRIAAEVGQWFPLAELEPDGPLVLAG